MGHAEHRAEKPDRAYRLSADRSDFLTVAERSERMSLVRGKDTKPEMLVRRVTHGMGYRYRLHDGSLPGKPDLVFKSKRKVIFVNGCFWHLHDCGKYRMPRTNLEFWQPKLDRNVERDAAAREKLESAGWKHLTIWECELADAGDVARRIKEYLDS